MNWPYIAFVIVASAVGLGFIGGAITAQAINETQHGLPLSGGFNWPIIIAIAICCITLFIALLWKVYRDWRTFITEDGIIQAGLLRVRSIRWDEVRRVTRVHYGIHIHGPGQRIVVTPYAYRQPDQIISYINEQVRKRSIPA